MGSFPLGITGKWYLDQGFLPWFAEGIMQLWPQTWGRHNPGRPSESPVKDVSLSGHRGIFTTGGLIDMNRAVLLNRLVLLSNARIGFLLCPFHVI